MCHYATAVRGLDGEIYKPFVCDKEKICADALALLKEQEAVEPRVSTAEQRCGNCNKVIEMDGWKACPWCGKMIDWKRWWDKNGTHDKS
jgi:rRNA maturation endonuclease Nob1